MSSGGSPSLGDVQMEPEGNPDFSLTAAGQDGVVGCVPAGPTKQRALALCR